MVAALIMSAKLAALGFLKIKVFWNKGYDVIIFVYTSPRKSYQMTQIILQIWSCGQSLVTLAFLSEKLS